MSILLQGFQVILSCICAIVLLFIGLYFKKHIKPEIGKNGFSTPGTMETEEGWLYAQVIGPQIAIRFGTTALVTALFVDALILFFGIDPENMIIYGNTIGFCFVIALLLDMERRVKDFLNSKLFLQDADTRKEWIAMVKEMIQKEPYARLLKFAESNCFDCEAMKTFLS